MAMHRRTPKCPYCKVPIGTPVYQDQSHLPVNQQIIGDTFLRWEYIEHECKEGNEHFENVLREINSSGNLESDIDIVVFLHKPDYYKKDKNESGTNN